MKKHICHNSPREYLLLQSSICTTLHCDFLNAILSTKYDSERISTIMHIIQMCYTPTSATQVSENQHHACLESFALTSRSYS